MYLARISIFLFLTGLLISASGCVPQSGRQKSPDSQPTGIPELTREVIDERINDARIFDVPPESGTGDSISWGFDWDEPKQISVVEQKMDGTKATIVLDIKTQSSPRSRFQRELVGQIRTEWKLESGWVLRRWEIANAENISMKYKDLPKPEATPPVNP